MRGSMGAVVAAVLAASLTSASQAQGADSAVNGYVDARVCARCHPAIWQTYKRTGMGRSFYRPTPANRVEDYAKENTYYHRASDSYFAMIERDGKYYQRRYQLGPDGQQINILEKSVDFVVGSGNHSRTYLHRSEKGALIELPLAWYAEKGGYWAMNPGYDRPDHPDFRRQIDYSCMFCHNAYAEVSAAAVEAGSAAVFPSSLPEGIDCQRCHGPGEKHVLAAQRASASVQEIRASITNPARLSPDRELEVCMQCHLETTSFPLPHAMVRYDRGPFSYMPGEPLEEFILQFDHAPGKGYDDKFEIAGAAYRMRKSACFLKSNGALRCTTCHNPHDVPRGAEAASHYETVCRQCHSAAFRRLVASGKHSQSKDCIGCHMPKRRTDDVVHVIITDHFIQRLKPTRNLLADIPEKREASGYQGDVDLYYPEQLPRPADELYLAVAQVIEGSNLKDGTARLSAAIEKYHPEITNFYSELADARRKSGRLEEAVRMYEETLRRKPNSAETMQKLALCLLDLRQPGRATENLKRASEIAPQDAANWHLLGLAYVEQGKAQDAAAAFQKAIQADPDTPEPYNSLGGIFYKTGDLKQAEPMLREAIRLRANYAEAHDNLGSLLTIDGRFDEARYHFEAALRYRENYSAARFNYAVMLGRAGKIEEAQQQVQAALKTDPGFAEAHDFLGTVLLNKGQRAQAIEQYREAVRLRPDFGRALLDLGAALLDSGDRAGATAYLQKAATNADSDVRDAAQKLLKGPNP